MQSPTSISDAASATLHPFEKSHLSAEQESPVCQLEGLAARTEYQAKVPKENSDNWYTMLP